MYMNRYLSLLMAAIFIASSNSHSAPVYEQPWDGVVSGSLSQEFASTPSNIVELADDFVAADNWNIRSVGWQGAYIGSVNPAISELDFVIRFYGDANGSPEINAFSEHFVRAELYPAGVSDTGALGFRFSANLAESVFFEKDNLYWISIMANNLFISGFDTAPNYVWSSANTVPGNNHTYRAASSLVAPAEWQVPAFPYNTADRAFTLVAVPIVPSVILMISAVLSLFGGLTEHFNRKLV